jgi:SulP family sulfate permease
MFLLSTVISQVVLVFSSSFDSGLGTSMAENIPFVHTFCIDIMNSFPSDSNINLVMATIVATMIISTTFNGVLFYLVGLFKMGNVLHFFPQHVILGMIGGFGIFLLCTAFEISTQISAREMFFSTILDLNIHG